MSLGISPSEIVGKGTYQLLCRASHWGRIPLSQVADVQNGFAFKSAYFDRESGVPLIRIRDIQRSHTDHRYFGEFDDRYKVRSGDILVGMDGDFTVARWKGEEGLLNQRVCRIQIEDSLFDGRFLFLCLQPYLDAINAETSSVTVKHLSSKTIENIPLPLPPLAEQYRFVAKIEELFSELDKGVENLEKARKQLIIYRQAVLKHAFEGKLTAQWREENKDILENREQLLSRIMEERQARYDRQFRQWNTTVKAWEEAGRSGKKPAKPRKPLDIEHLPDASSDKWPELPEGWIWVRVGSICEVVRGGSPRPAGDTRYYGGTIPFLKVADLTRTAGAYIETHSYSIKEAGLRKTRLVNPPVLMLSNSGATLGVPKICRIRTTFNDGIAAFPGLDESDLPYHYYFWVSKTSELRAINQGAAQPNLNIGLIQDVTIPLCSKKEMQIVARDIERALSICDRLNADIDTQFAKSEALRQSILKKAFSGQLVAQDPNDEPASVLLQRIKAQKVAQSQSAKLPNKRRRAKATA